MDRHRHIYMLRLKSYRPLRQNTFGGQVTKAHRLKKKKNTSMLTSSHSLVMAPFGGQTYGL